MQKNRPKNNPAQPIGNDKPWGDGNSIEERVNEQSEQDRVSFVPLDKFFLVDLLSEMKVGSNRVFEKMDDQIAQQHKKGRTLTAKLNACRKDLHDRGGQHETRA